MSDETAKLKKHIVLDMPPKRRMPKRIAARIDALYEVREERLAYTRLVNHAKEKVVPYLVEREMEIAKELAKELRGLGDASKMSGQIATFSPYETDIFSVEDWDEYWQFMVDNNAPELLERRPARGALKERLVNDTLPTCVKAGKKFAYSLTKVGKPKK